MPDTTVLVRKKMRLGEQLVRGGLITEQQLSDALGETKETGSKLGEVLVRKGFVTESEILKVVSEQTSTRIYSKEAFPIEESATALLPAEDARKGGMVPLCIRDQVLYVAMTDAQDYRGLDRLSDLVQMEVEPVLCLRQEFVQLFNVAYGQYSGFNRIVDVVKATAAENSDPTVGSNLTVLQEEEDIDTGSPNDAPVIRLVNVLLTEAVRQGASDVHINPEKSAIHVRYRIDGLLRRVSQIPANLGPSLVSRIKILSNMDISVTRAPQDGRFSVMVDRHEINIRVSTLPTTYGENVVMRLLDMSSHRVYALDKLGMEAASCEQIELFARRPYGMILSTGPTGSGKSTSLYSILQIVNREDVNIITLEDPVEYRMPGVRQVSLNTRAGMTFASGLRSILRQDPDIIMVGEIRDAETAKIAVQAALTGHLVLSTLHTNDAPTAVGRLIDMGVEPYLVSSVLLCIFAQRLVRTICPNCREEYEPSGELLAKYGLTLADGPFYHGRGCPQCGNTGFAGRTGLFEVFPVDEDVQQEVNRGRSLQELYRLRAQKHWRTMLNDAADKIRSGRTTVEEAIRVTMA